MTYNRCKNLEGESEIDDVIVSAQKIWRGIVGHID